MIKEHQALVKAYYEVSETTPPPPYHIYRVSYETLEKRSRLPLAVVGAADDINEFMKAKGKGSLYYTKTNVRRYGPRLLATTSVVGEFVGSLDADFLYVYLPYTLKREVKRTCSCM